MLIMYMVTYPLSSLDALTEVLVENMRVPLPDGVTVDGWYTAWGGEGIETHLVYDVSDATEEGGEFLTSMVAYYSKVPGFKVKCDNVMPIHTVLALAKHVSP